jgi:hypothetical protein
MKSIGVSTMGRSKSNETGIEGEAANSCLATH